MLRIILRTHMIHETINKYVPVGSGEHHKSALRQSPSLTEAGIMMYANNLKLFATRVSLLRLTE